MRIGYNREVLNLIDGDRLALDWVKSGNRRLIVLTHGMEGSSERFYVKRAANYFAQREWDVLAWNARGCGGQTGIVVKLRHHGNYEDLQSVMNHALEREYDEIVLIGFSMGGSQTLSYLSLNGLDTRVLGGIGFSVTFDFEDMMTQLQKPQNFLYRNIFLSKMKKRVVEYAAIDERVDKSALPMINTFEDFHLKYTVQLNSYSSLKEFYREASPVFQIPNLKRPFLAVNALNDPILGDENYPVAVNSDFFKIETPKYGGHLGFTLPNKGYSFMETRADLFICNDLKMKSF
ncbi:MAG: alpha/beta fold hydrolase [Cyclobacteriaceae bacterium]